MISPTELRIGNYVKNKHIDEPVKVLEVLTSRILINANKQLINSKSYTVPLFAYEGIPLTPEILEKCGFGINKYAASIRLGSNKNDSYLYYTLEDDVFGFCIENSDFDANSDLTEELPIELPNIKYLHQLQNLYHALTGTELEINL